MTGGRYAPLPPPVEPLPRHVAFIMDGNGRWARARGFRRLRGHRQGAASLRRITRYCARIGIEEITFYALSTENYARRPRSEVAYLMRLLRQYLIDERGELADGDIRLRAIGRTSELPPDVLAELHRTMELTSSHRGMVLRLALNYGGRGEIIDAVRAMAAEVRDGQRPLEDLEGLTEEMLRERLYDASMTDPDLVVRTAGEARLSNFLLWQAHYAEIYVTDVLWPDFDIEHLDAALRFFAACDRKFGALDAVDAGDRASPRQSSRSRASFDEGLESGTGSRAPATTER